MKITYRRPSQVEAYSGSALDLVAAIIRYRADEGLPALTPAQMAAKLRALGRPTVDRTRTGGAIGQRIAQLVAETPGATGDAIFTLLRRKREFLYVDHEREKAGCDTSRVPCPKGPHFHKPSALKPRLRGGFIPRTVTAVKKMIVRAQQRQARIKES